MTEAYGGETVCCEAYGPAGAALIVACRADAGADAAACVAERVRPLLRQRGAHPGAPGSVAYLFRGTGLLRCADRPGLADVAQAAGAEDVRAGGTPGTPVEVLTDPAELATVRERLERAGFAVLSAGVTLRAGGVVPLAAEPARQLAALCDELRRIDGVTGVYTNAPIP
jgi:transcriptional/translational regulatory protein YebC/TACO1